MPSRFSEEFELESLSAGYFKVRVKERVTFANTCYPEQIPFKQQNPFLSSPSFPALLHHLQHLASLSRSIIWAQVNRDSLKYRRWNWFPFIALPQEVKRTSAVDHFYLINENFWTSTALRIFSISCTNTAKSRKDFLYAELKLYTKATITHINTLQWEKYEFQDIISLLLLKSTLIYTMALDDYHMYVPWYLPGMWEFQFQFHSWI